MMLDLRKIEVGLMPAGLGLVLFKVEDYHALVAEIERLRKRVCYACSSDMPLRADGTHIDYDGSIYPCEAAEAAGDE